MGAVLRDVYRCTHSTQNWMHNLSFLRERRVENRHPLEDGDVRRNLGSPCGRKIRKLRAAPHTSRGLGGKRIDGIPWIFGGNGPPFTRLDLPITRPMAAVVMGATARFLTPTGYGYRGGNSDIADLMKPKRAPKSDQNWPKSLAWDIAAISREFVPTAASGGDIEGSPYALGK